MYVSTPAWSRTSSPTTAHDGQRPLTALYMLLKYETALPTRFHVSCVLWLTSFHAPKSLTPSARKYTTILPTLRL